jgi:carboxylate-amine ligase
VLLDHAMIYFDARLSDRYPTVELRVADVCLNVADTVLIATLARALVDTAATAWRHHAPAPTVRTGLIRLANWRAARSGLDGPLLDPLTSRPRRAADVGATLLEHVGPALVEAGDLDRVTAAWSDLRQRGTGAAAQRAWTADHGLAGMVLRAAAATTDGDV